MHSNNEVNQLINAVSFPQVTMVKLDRQDSAAPVDQMGNQTSQDPGGTLALLELKGMKVRRYSFS